MEELIEIKESPNKLFVISRRDLTPAQQLVQSVHAAIDFILKFPELSQSWRVDSNHIASLSVRDEVFLNKILAKAIEQNIKCISFKEPDMNLALTAIALEPSDEAKKLCKKIMPTFWEPKLP